MHVVIVGGGFGGIKTALLLQKKRGVKVTLITDKDHFTYYPSLYATATGGAQRQSFVPLSVIFAHTSVHVIHDTVVGYDPLRRQVRMKSGKHVSFDRVVFALGVVTSYFGIQGLETYSLGIKSAREVAGFRKHIHDELVSDRKLDKQYVVVGAGPTGVELAATLASYIAHIARAHDVKFNKIRIKLVEAAPRVLPRMSEHASALVAKRLMELGVSIMINEKVEWQDDDEVFVSGRSIPTKTVIWTSGVTNHPFFAKHHTVFPLTDNKKVIVDEHLMINNSTYVIGDNAATKYSGLAQTALHDAHFVAEDIINYIEHQPRISYKPYMPPVVIPVGRRWALLEWRWVLISDYFGHVIRRAADLIGYRDILPLREAIKAWRSEDAHEDTCPVCRSFRA